MLNVAKCYVSDLTGCILPVGLLYCGCHSQITNVIAMQPPFVMDKWIVGIQQNQRVDYTVNYEVSHFSSSQNNANLPISHLKYEFENALKAITEPSAISIIIFDTKYPFILLLFWRDTSEWCQVTKVYQTQLSSDVESQWWTRRDQDCGAGRRNNTSWHRLGPQGQVSFW